MERRTEVGLGTGFDIGLRGMSEMQQGFLRCMAAFANIPKRELNGQGSVA